MGRAAQRGGLGGTAADLQRWQDACDLLRLRGAWQMAGRGPILLTFLRSCRSTDRGANCRVQGGFLRVQGDAYRPTSSIVFNAV